MIRRRALFVAAVVLSACGTPQTRPEESSVPAQSTVVINSSPRIAFPSASVPVTSSPSPAPSSAAVDEVPPVALLQSTVDGLQIRTGPSLSAALFEFPCGPAGCGQRVLINAGWTMVALSGPVAADGYDWYLVQLTPEYPGSAHLGWAATPESGDDWLVPAAYPCPSSAPTLDAAIELGALRLLYCFGAEELSFDGYVVTGFGCNVVGTFEPAWLAHPCANMSFVSAEQGSNDHLFLHYPAPGVINPTLELSDGQAVRIRGHFDDTAAVGCVMEYDTAAEVEPSGTITAWDVAADMAQCRMRFVVTGVTVVPQRSAIAMDDLHGRECAGSGSWLGYSQRVTTNIIRHPCVGMRWSTSMPDDRHSGASASSK